MKNMVKQEIPEDDEFTLKLRKLVYEYYPDVVEHEISITCPKK